MRVTSAGTGRVLELNQSAGDVWLLSDGDYTVPEVVALLARHYGRTAAEIEDDVRRTVDRFYAEGLLSGRGT